ncbi:MAG: hypothetical protein ACRDDY_09935 [Clostridium sp.]|uniref:hypothetical protein n=1 Tax=Clostridium sp. TaxID=1506 RepID=UPI003EE5A273
MRRTIIIVVIIVFIILAGISYYFSKETKVEVIKQTNVVNSKQTIEAVTKEINLESNS